MDLGLRNRTAIVLGSTSGLGLASARRLAAEGASVMFCGRRLDLAESAAAEFPHCAASALNLADDQSLDEAIEACRNRLGAPDIVVLNSGGPPPGTASALNLDQLESSIHMMLLAQIKIVTKLLPGMLDRSWGRIVAIGSSGVQQPIPSLAQSNIARAGLAAYLKSLTGNVSRHGVTTNMVLPGRIATERIAALDRAASERTGKPVRNVQQESETAIPLGRYGRPDEFGDVVAFVCSERASYITGSQIRVDGGLISAI
ncbi:SDR family oxidoreductase [Agromyces sp. Soil535]|uniref:SDR family oxidoreductase n=1 Tax=Agromyces sp. Soil535 TaxID=1736390 RepID=UPI0007022369|nr:SDR family oxidoreductase [Agromyces sp. Soil535]KRE28279.1 3-oxoacyl-ACP reductase [Agromyces sp. Soil535]